MTNDALPPLTEAQKHHAFEWLRQQALEHQTAYVAFRAWAELKASQSEADQRDAALEEAAELFDGYSYGQYLHPSAAIRALKRPKGD